MIPNEYVCLNCGERFFEEPSEPICIVCFADSVVDADYAERMSDDYESDEDYR